MFDVIELTPFEDDKHALEVHVLPQHITSMVRRRSIDGERLYTSISVIEAGLLFVTESPAEIKAKINAVGVDGEKFTSPPIQVKHGR